VVVVWSLVYLALSRLVERGLSASHGEGAVGGVVPVAKLAKAIDEAKQFAEQVSARQPDPRWEEVRLAMGLNGGVSLAVWMGGVAVELDCARRARYAPEPPSAESKAARTIYHAICTAFYRSLVIDIMSGASAGGLNGSLLAGAIRKGRRIHPDLLRAKWLDTGDFLQLLQPLRKRDLRSLMQGGSSPTDAGVFYSRVRLMFSAILGDGDAKPEEKAQCVAPADQLVEPLDAVLDVMMTNIQGEPRRFRDVWGFELAAREYRAPFQLRKDSDFTVENLATASRASASFPVAFEPFRVGGSSAALAGLVGSRYAVDGGLLENAPIDAAMRLIPTRPAQSAVKRFVCYLNAAPPTAEDADEDPASPGPALASVVGYVINLPRDGRFVDQLYAVEQARRRASVSSSAQPRLVSGEWEALKSVALSILPTYRRRRCALALEDVLRDPSAVQSGLEGLGPDAVVSWLPLDLEAPPDGASWRWGIRAGERVLHLEIDFVRQAFAAARGDEERRAVLEARLAVDAQLGLLASLRETAAGVVRAEVEGGIEPLAAIAATDTWARAAVYDAVATATDAFLGVVGAGFLGDTADPETLGGAIFGAMDAPRANGTAEDGGEVTGLDPEAEAVSPRVNFLRRALATEVIQRAFSTDEDIETGQPLLFAQLTPLAPTRIFSAQPFAATSAPDSGEDKLTGIRLVHFSGFYRRSWRANDYMWGRFDGATRIVDLLVDPARAAEVLKFPGAGAPADVLRDALLPEEAAADVQASLIEEAFRDALRPDSGVPQAVRTLLGAYGQGPATAGAALAASETPLPQLRADLASAIAADLAIPGGDALFTRVILSRALQYEVLADEIEHVATETSGDQKLGSFTPPLQFSADDPTQAISLIRSWYEEGKTLPGVLGRDDRDESTSDLALQTLSHTLFVAFVALRGVNVTLGKIVSIARAPLLPVSGIASRHFWNRVGVLVGFAAAVIYVVTRLTTAKHNAAPLGSLWSVPVLLSWLAALGVAGVVVVPLVRTLRTKSWRRRFTQGVMGLLLLAATLGLPIGLARVEGKLHFAQILATPGSFGLPVILAGVTFTVVLGGSPLVGLRFLPGSLAKPLQPIADKLPMFVVIGHPAALDAVFSSVKLVEVMGSNWQAIAAISAFAAIPLFAVYLVFGSRY
jgi:predicted acylesterase/phospholipase RssA